MLALTSPTIGGPSVSIVRLRTKATEFVCLFVCLFVEADEAARDFKSSIAPAYRLTTSKVTFSDLNNYIPDLYRQLKHKQG
jgi:hypothetical protein